MVSMSITIATLYRRQGLLPATPGGLPGSDEYEMPPAKETTTSQTVAALWLETSTVVPSLGGSHWSF